MRRVRIGVVVISVLGVMTAGVVGALAVARTDDPHAPTILQAAGLPGPAIVADEPTTTAPTTVVSPTTVVPTTAAPATTVATTVAPPTKPVAPPPTTTSPTTTSPTTAVAPTTTVAPKPSSWSESSNGVSITLRMEPAAPQAGDSVRFFYRATSSLEWCCLVNVSVNGALAVPMPPMVGCPDLSAELQFTAVAPASGLLVQVDAARGNICTLPPATLTSARLLANIPVGPAR